MLNSDQIRVKFFRMENSVSRLLDNEICGNLNCFRVVAVLLPRLEGRSLKREFIDPWN